MPASCVPQHISVISACSIVTCSSLQRSRQLKTHIFAAIDPHAQRQAHCNLVRLSWPQLELLVVTDASGIRPANGGSLAFTSQVQHRSATLPHTTLFHTTPYDTTYACRLPWPTTRPRPKLRTSWPACATPCHSWAAARLLWTVRSCRSCQISPSPSPARSLA